MHSFSRQLVVLGAVLLGCGPQYLGPDTAGDGDGSDADGPGDGPGDSATGGWDDDGGPSGGGEGSGGSSPSTTGANTSVDTGLDTGVDPTGACNCGEPNCGECPNTETVLTPWFAIESREVSKRDYEAFLDANPDPALQPSACAWNSSFVPTDEWPPAADTDHPVVFVDWCDARAYCDWAGRRLCGRIGGGSNDFADYANPYQSEWMWSCSEEGTRTFAWGSTYNGSACNGLDYGAGSTLPVGSLSTCEGGLPGLFDMGGNVWEWEDSCQADSGAGDLCRRRGGSAWSDESLISCNIGGYDTRDTVFKYVGIRCCDDL